MKNYLKIIKDIIPIILAFFFLIFFFSPMFLVQTEKGVIPSLSKKGLQKINASLLETSAEGAVSVLIDGSERKILFEKNYLKPQSIASVTKLMSALVFYKYFYSSENEDLINKALVVSDNLAVEELAQRNEKEKFLKAMNSEAEKLGLKNTKFFNASGLDLINEQGERYGNYASPEDLVNLVVYIKENYPEIFEKTLIEEDDGKKNTNEMIFTKNWPVKILGGKTGETPLAKQNLVLITEDPDSKGYLINIVLNSQDRFGDTKNLLEWTFQSYNWDNDYKNFSWQRLSDAQWETRDAHTFFSFKNKLWLLGGLNGNENVYGYNNVVYESSPHFSDLWSSQDGRVWDLISDNGPCGKIRSASAVEFKGKSLIFAGWNLDGGYKNDLFSSLNGLDWLTEKTNNFSVREGQASVVFKDKIFMTGGVRFDTRETKNDVWFSEDGINWQSSILDASWVKRYDHTLAVFKDKLWLMGGLDFGENLLNDVWFSEDGINWNKVNVPADFPARHGHASFVFDNKLWVMSGWGEGEKARNDVWYTEDGENWKRTWVDLPWLGREDFGQAELNGKIYITGGMDNNWHWNNDVWVGAIK